MHESIYGQGAATDWAAWRVLEEFPEFRPDAAEVLLTGEMVYPWYFEQDPALRPLQEVARTAGGQVGLDAAVRPGAAGRQHRSRRPPPSTGTTSTWTASSPWRPRPPSAGCRSWETGEFHHDGIADDGEAIFGRLLGMVRSAR